MPPEPILRAAARWLELIPGNGVDRVRSILHTSRRYADLTPTQYEVGLAWLESTSLVTDSDAGGRPSRRVFARAVQQADWFADADMLVREPSELPEDALTAADGLGISEAEAFQYLQVAWGKVDTSERERVGAVGEHALAALLRDTVDGEIEHVAAWADGFGYDIAVTSGTRSLHLEVKSTTRRGRITVYVSRNEYNVMLCDPDWHLVLVRLTSTLDVEAIATIPGRWLVTVAPDDRRREGRWESSRFVVPPDELMPGMPALADLVTGAPGSELILGRSAWV